MTNLDSILKSRDITNVHLVKAMVFPVVMYGFESWTIRIHLGMTQRDVVGKEVGGGFMFGNACKN